MDGKKQNCLSGWFPKIEAAGLPVPRTEIVTTDVPLLGVLMGDPPKGYDEFLAELRQAVERIGTPCFLRTGQGSGKDEWNRTRNVRKIEDLPGHVANLIERSRVADIPIDVWAVREMLPTKALVVLPGYDDLPVARQWRLFVRDAKVLCRHPFFSRASLVQGIGSTVGAESLFGILRRSTPLIAAECVRLAEAAGRAVGGGYWSVDILETTRGLYVTDMAQGEDSFHWPGCVYGTKEGRRTASEPIIETAEQPALAVHRYCRGCAALGASCNGWPRSMTFACLSKTRTGPVLTRRSR